MLGLIGAAIATAGASLVYNALKFLFIKKNFSLQPFDLKTLKIIVVILIVWLIVNFVPVISSPIADIAIRSLIIIAFYGGIIYFWKIVPELEPVFLSYLKKITGR
jgi:membrane associated rhomboid family serine protease